MTDKLFITKMNEIRERIRSTLGAVTLTDFIEELLEDRKWLFERLEIAVNYDPSEKLRIERDELAEALKQVMIGGNHLALLIGADHPPADCYHDKALSHYGAGDKYEIWCCWKTIMLARAALSRLGKDDK